MNIPVAILAGGLATRLGSLTESVPKALLDIAGKPFAVRQVELLREHGFHEIVFCLGHLGHQVQEALGDGSRWSTHITYSFDGCRAMGTGGALKKALPLLASTFVVLYGDSYLECDYQTIVHAFRASEKRGLMTVFRNDGRWDNSNVVFENGTIKAYDKRHRTAEMHYIDYGMGLLDASVFDAYPPDQSLDLAVVYQDLLAQNQLAAFEVNQRFYEIGSPVGLQEMCQHFQEGQSTR
jgi:NDP-sugar pyrophosphorylase family protein